MTVSVPKVGAPVTIVPKDPEMLVSSIFKRKLAGLGGDRSQGRKTSRCLFGVPDANVVIQQANEVQSRMQQAFESRWGFSLKNEGPLIAEEVPKGVKVQSGVAARYEWTQVRREPESMVQLETVKKADKDLRKNERCVKTSNEIERLHPSKNASASVQTETNHVVTQGTQTSRSFVPEESLKHSLAEYDLYFVARKRKSTPIPVPGKKERTLPRPLTFLPSSPDAPVMYNCVQSSSLESMNGEELMESHHQGLSSPLSPSEDGFHDETSPPIERRNSTGEVFVFPDNTEFKFESLHIRHGSPARCYSAESKRMKQRCITDYMQVKKTKLNFSKI